MFKPQPAATVASTLFLAFTLAACSRSISTVKDSDAPNAGYKIGQVLDHKANCASSSWSQGKDSNDRPMVEFQCKLIVSDAVIKGIADAALEASRHAVEQRLHGGKSAVPAVGLPGLHGLDTLEGREHDFEGLDPASDQAKRLADDGDAAAQMMNLRQKWAEVEAQADSVDSECRKQLPSVLAEREAVITKALTDHRQYLESIQFILKDDQIIERRLNITDDDGHDVSIPPGVLYGMMLNPNDRPDQQGSEERVILHEAVKLPPDEFDYQFCGHQEKYVPISERFEALDTEAGAIWKGFSDRRWAAAHPSVGGSGSSSAH